MALDGSAEKVKLVSADGVEFSIDYDAAMLSETLKNSIEGEVEIEEIKIKRIKTTHTHAERERERERRGWKCDVSPREVARCEEKKYIYTCVCVCILSLCVKNST